MVLFSARAPCANGGVRRFEFISFLIELYVEWPKKKKFDLLTAVLGKYSSSQGEDHSDDSQATPVDVYEVWQGLLPILEKVHHCCGLRHCHSAFQVELAMLQPQWLEQFQKYVSGRWAWRMCSFYVFHGVPGPESITSQPLSALASWS